MENNEGMEGPEKSNQVTKDEKENQKIRLCRIWLDQVMTQENQPTKDKGKSLHLAEILANIFAWEVLLA